jgi:hypothetical protein
MTAFEDEMRQALAAHAKAATKAERDAAMQRMSIAIRKHLPAVREQTEPVDVKQRQTGEREEAGGDEHI